MSGLALGWARKRKDAPSREAKACLMYVADNANDQMAWPSKRTLAEDMMCSEKTVMRLLADLVSAGLLVRLDVEDKATGRTRTCGYYFPVQGRPPLAGEIAAFEREVGGRVTLVSPWEGDTDGTGEGDTGVTGRGTTVSPLYEPPLKPESSDELSTGEGEGAQAREILISEIEAAMPARLASVSDRDAYRAALGDLAAEGVDLADLPGCLGRWAVDPLFLGRKVPVPLEKWLRSGQWRGSLPAADAEAAGPPEPSPDATPPSLPKDVAGVIYPAGLATYLGGAEWRDGERLLVCRLGFQADEVRKRARAELFAAGVRVTCRKDLQREGLG